MSVHKGHHTFYKRNGYNNYRYHNYRNNSKNYRNYQKNNYSSDNPELYRYLDTKFDLQTKHIDILTNNIQLLRKELTDMRHTMYFINKNINNNNFNHYRSVNPYKNNTLNQNSPVIIDMTTLMGSKNRPSSNNLLSSVISKLMSQPHKSKSDDNTIDEESDTEVSIYGSDDEFEILDIDFNNIDDLIKAGNLYTDL